MTTVDQIVSKGRQALILAFLNNGGIASDSEIDSIIKEAIEEGIQAFLCAPPHIRNYIAQSVQPK